MERRVRKDTSQKGILRVLCGLCVRSSWPWPTPRPHRSGALGLRRAHLRRGPDAAARALHRTDDVRVCDVAVARSTAINAESAEPAETNPKNQRNPLCVFSRTARGPRTDPG